MLQQTSVEKGTLDLIRKLSADETFKEFALVGGTALALIIGHRVSIDIDLFSNKEFDSKRVATHLQEVYKAEDIKTLNNCVFSYIEGIKIDMLTHNYRWVNPPHMIEGVNIASLDDIAAMKINAIIKSGERLKDFVDIHFLLEHRSMDEILKAFTEKYPDGSQSVAKLALLYHVNIDHKINVDYLRPKPDWGEMVHRLKNAMLNPGIKFNEDQHVLKPKTDEDEHSLNRRRRR